MASIFSKIISGEIPSHKVAETTDFLAFLDIQPLSIGHVLVIPKGDYLNFSDFSAKADAAEIADFFKKVAMIATNLDLDKSGYRIISNIGADASQSVAHFHVHILGKKKLGALVAGDINH